MHLLGKYVNTYVKNDHRERVHAIGQCRIN